jgi:hypothetical protein
MDFPTDRTPVKWRSSLRGLSDESSPSGLPHRNGDSRARLDSLALKVSQMNILVVVAKLGDARPADVCRILKLDASTLSRNVERIPVNMYIQGTPPGKRRLTIVDEGKNATPVRLDADRLRRICLESGVDRRRIPGGHHRDSRSRSNRTSFGPFFAEKSVPKVHRNSFSLSGSAFLPRSRYETCATH